jgi:proteasome lid subunit RPN8/RPN11
MGVIAKGSNSASAAGTKMHDRDADHINPDEWPVRAMSPKVAGRSTQYQVVFSESVVNDIRAHGESSPEAEVCGVLVGNIYHDQAGPYCYVKANIHGNHAPGRNSQVTFTSETWTAIHEQMEAHFTDQKIVGWYHTHPGFGVFLSEMDLFIQNNFFNEVWQIAYVDDPKGGDRGVFVWQDGAAVRRPYLVDAGRIESVPLTGIQSGGLEAAPRNDGEAPTKIEQSPKNGLSLLENAARIRTLQRHLAREKRRLRMLIAVAIASPIILLALLVRTGFVSTDKIKSLIPTKAAVDKWVGNAAGATGRR